jgi:hypothetical protein
VKKKEKKTLKCIFNKKKGSMAFKWTITEDEMVAMEGELTLLPFMNPV